LTFVENIAQVVLQVRVWENNPRFSQSIIIVASPLLLWQDGFSI